MELLKLLGDTRKSGTLIVSAARASKRIYLVEGTIVSADSTDPNEMLGHFLISRGLASEEQVRQALEVQERTNVFSGAALVKLGALDQQTLEQVLEEKTEEIIYGLFEWEAGSFHFQPGQKPPESLAIPLELRVEDVLWRGTARQDELARIREVFPSPELIPRLIREVAPGTLSGPLAERIHGLIDGARSVAQIQLAVHSSEYMVGRHLFALFSAGCLAVMAPQRAARMPKPGEARAVEQADEMLRDGRYSEALVIYRSAVDRGVDRPDLQKLIEGTERLLLDKIYREDLPPNAALQRVYDSRQILEADFSPEQFFLVDQIDGRRTTKTLVRTCPLREVDTLLILRQLIRRKVIRVVEAF